MRLSVISFTNRILARKTYPTTRIRDHRNCTAIGIRYDPESFLSLVELFTMAAKNNPIVIASW
jgi:hypothetical protein